MSKYPVIRLHLLLLAASLLLSGLARAQVDLSDQETVAPKAWNGLDLDGKALTTAAEYPDTETLDSKLAQAKFLRDVARDFRSADEILQAAWLQVNYHEGFDERYGRMKGRHALYAQNIDKVMRARVELAEATGRGHTALQWTNNPYFHAQEAVALGVGMESIDEECAQAIFSQANMLWWVSKRTLLQARLDQEPAESMAGLTPEQGAYVQEHFGRTSEELAQRVREAVQEGSMTIISSLGLRATPSLAALVLADLEGTRFGSDIDPLYALATVDPSGACRLAVDYFDKGGQSFRLRVLSMVETYRPFTRPEVWDYPQPYVEGNKLYYQPPRCQVPYWIDTVAKLASDRRTRARVYNLVDTIASRDAITPAMQEALIAALSESDERGAIEILANVETGSPIPSAFPILEAAMKHKSDQVRRRAAQALVAYQESEALLAAASDSDAEVRRFVASSLLMRTVPEPSFNHPRSAAQNSSLRIGPHVTETTSQVLSSLLSDADENTRRVAAQALAQQGWSFQSSKPYIAAAETHDAGITAFLLRATYPEEETRAVVLKTLATSPSLDVRTELDQFLLRDADWETSAEIWGPILIQRISDPARPIDMGQVMRNLRRGDQTINLAVRDLVRSRLFQSPEGMWAALTAARVLGDPMLLESALIQRNSSVSEALALSSDKERVELMTLALSSDDDVEKLMDLIGRAALRDTDWSKVDVQPYFALLQNDGLDADGRAALLKFLTQSGAPGVLDQAIAFASASIDELHVNSTAAIFAHFGTEDQVRAAREILSDKTAPPHLVIAISRAALQADHSARVELARALLQSSLHAGYEKTSGFGPPAFAILMQESDWTDNDRNLLIAAMNASAEDLYQPAILAAQQLRDPRMLPVLGSLFRETTQNTKQLNLVQAMGSYMTREAGEQLVQCLGAASDLHVRQTIQNQLSQIRSYLQEAEYWAGEEKREATRTQAVLELVEMLDDKDPEIRAAAIDGLASFDAKEYLPRIIRMLKDESAIVQRAARNAVRLLQRGVSTIEEPGGDSKGN